MNSLNYVPAGECLCECGRYFYFSLIDTREQSLIKRVAEASPYEIQELSDLLDKLNAIPIAKGDFIVPETVRCSHCGERFSLAE